MGEWLRHGCPEKFELEFKPLSAWLSISVYSTEKGYFTAVFENITERKQAEYSLMKSEANLAKSQEMAHIGSWEMDVETGEIDRSQESYRIFGCAPGDVELNYRWFLECIVPEDRERVDNVIKLSMKTGQPYDIIYNIKRRDGESRILFSHGEAIKDASGHIIKIFGTNQDLTEQKRAEERLRNSEARFRSYFELPIIGIGITSVDKKWIQINDKLCEILGYSREELLHRTWVEITHPDDIPKNIELFNKVISGEIDGYTLDKRFIRKNGDIVYIIIFGRLCSSL